MSANSPLNLQVPELIRQLENALRSGYNLYQAFDIAARDMDAPMRDDAVRLTAALRDGLPFNDALAQWVTRAASPDLDLVVGCIRVQFETGGNLADKLNLLGQIMARRILTIHA